MEYYQKILKEHSDSLYVVQARNRYRTLRGDSTYDNDRTVNSPHCTGNISSKVNMPRSID